MFGSSHSPQKSNHHSGRSNGQCRYSVGFLYSIKFHTFSTLTFCFSFRTDAMIQRTIREKFDNCTVITVAHRLNTVIDSDRVLVMDAGVAVEFDAPYSLMQNENGVFHNMVKALGQQEYDQLFVTAKKKFEEVVSEVPHVA